MDLIVVYSDRWIPAVGVIAALAVATVTARTARARAGTAQLGGLGVVGLALASLVAVILPVLGYWIGGRTHPNALGGLVPWNDAAGYFDCALVVLDGGDLSSFCQRRPAYSLYLAGLLALVRGELQLALLVQALASAAAIFVVAIACARRWGYAAAIMAVATLAAFAATVSVTTLTENLGLPLGAAAIVLFVSGTRTRDPVRLAAGAFALAVALNARAGAFLVLPLLALSPLVSPGPGGGARWRLAVLIVVGGAAGFVPGIVVSTMLGGSAGATHSNFAYTLYGLVAGGERWTYVLALLPRLVGDGASEAEISRAMYAAAWRLFLDQPHLLLVGIFQGFLEYLQPLLTYVDWLPARLAIAVCWLWGLAAIVFRRQRGEETALGLLMAGVMASAPVLSIDGDTRVFAATVAVDALLAAYGLARIAAAIGDRRATWGWLLAVVGVLVVPTAVASGDPRAYGGAMVAAGLVALLAQRRIPVPAEAPPAAPPDATARDAWAVVAITLVLAFVVPFAVRAIASRPALAIAAGACGAGEEAMVARLGRDSPVLSIVAAGEGRAWPVAAVRDAFRDRIDPLTAGYDDLRALAAGTHIVMAHDIAPAPGAAGRTRLLLGTGGALASDGRRYLLCTADWPTAPLRDARRIVATHPLEPSANPVQSTP